MGILTAVRQRLTLSRRGVLAILAGTAGGQVVALLAAPVLTRLYTPEDFGIFTVLSAMAVTVGAMSALRFELAIPLPSREEDAFSLVSLGFLAAGGTAVVGTLTVAVTGEQIVRLFEQPRLMPWLWLVPVIGSVMGSYLVLNQLAIRQRRFGAIGRRTLAGTVATVTTQIAAGAGGLRAGGLILGLALGQLTGAVSLLRGSGLRGDKATAGRKLHNICRNAHRYRRFPWLLTPAGLLNVLGLQLPVLFIASWYGTQVAGWLGLTQRILAVPVSLIGLAIGQVYLAELARAALGNPQRARMLFSKASRALVTIGLIVAAVLIVAAPELFSFAFGTQWRVSGVYAQALSLGFAAQILAAPLSQTLIVYERQTMQLLWDMGRLVIVMASVAGTAATGASALTTMWSFSISSAFAYLASWLLTRDVLRTR